MLLFFLSLNVILVWLCRGSTWLCVSSEQGLLWLWTWWVVSKGESPGRGREKIVSQVHKNGKERKQRREAAWQEGGRKIWIGKLNVSNLYWLLNTCLKFRCIYINSLSLYSSLRKNTIIVFTFGHRRVKELVQMV